MARSPPPGSGARAGAGGQPARTNRAMPDAHKAQRRGAEPRAATATGTGPGPHGYSGSGKSRRALMCPALLPAGRLSHAHCICMPSLGAPGGVDASSSSISTRPTPWPARRSRATTGQRPVAVPMPTSHPYKGSEQEARQGPRVYVHGPALRSRVASWSMFRRGSFSHMCLPFQFSISMCGALFPSCWGAGQGAT